MKAKKSVKKSSQKAQRVSFDYFNASKAIIALLILLVAFSTLVIFKVYQTNIIQNNMFAPFMALTALEMGLLVGLLFLINPHKKK